MNSWILTALTLLDFFEPEFAGESLPWIDGFKEYAHKNKVKNSYIELFLRFESAHKFVQEHFSFFGLKMEMRFFKFDATK